MRKTRRTNEFARFWIQGGILFFQYMPKAIVDLQAAQKIVSDRVQFQGEKAYPVLCDIRKGPIADKAARDFLATSGSALVKAVGILACRPAPFMMTRFYQMINKPSIPTRVFTDKTQALEFLKNYL